MLLVLDLYQRTFVERLRLFSVMKGGPGTVGRAEDEELDIISYSEGYMLKK